MPCRQWTTWFGWRDNSVRAGALERHRPDLTTTQWIAPMGKGYVDLTPKQRAAAAERARSLKSPSRQAEQDRMRLIGEKLDLNHLRKADTAPATPPEPTPSRKKTHAGRPRSIAQDQIDKGIAILQSQDKMSVKAARQTLREAGIEGEDGPLYRLIIKPAYDNMSK
jgi:hypothetical protein